MSDPRQMCLTCGAIEIITPDGRGFPPAIAKRRLAKKCKAKGHQCKPIYRAGMSPELEAMVDETRRTAALAELQRVGMEDHPELYEPLDPHIPDEHRFEEDL